MGSAELRSQGTGRGPNLRQYTKSFLFCHLVGDMVDGFVQSLSLLILLSVSGLNGGLSAKMDFSVAPGGAAGVAGEAVIEQGGSAWRALSLSMMRSKPGLPCSGTCAAEDTGDPSRQVGILLDEAFLF